MIVSAMPTIQIISKGNTTIMHYVFSILHFGHLPDKSQFDKQKGRAVWRARITFYRSIEK